MFDGCATLTRWREANRDVGIYIVMKVVLGFRLCLDQPDAWHQYGPASPTNDWGGGTYAISPGFWKANNPNLGSGATSPAGRTTSPPCSPRASASS